MSKTTTIRKRKGYLIPIEGSDLQGAISRGWKYVPIDGVDPSKCVSRGRRGRFVPLYYKKIRIWPCIYCDQVAAFMPVFHHSGYDTIERLCQKCVKVHGPIPSEINDDTVLGL